MAPRTKLAWLCGVMVLTQSALAFAKPDAAKRFDEGLAHYRRHEYAEAADAFFRAFEASPTADALYNAGLAWELAGDPAKAATAYELAEALGLPPKTLQDTKTRLARLAPILQRVEVSAPAGSEVHSEPFVIEGEKAVLYFNPGKRHFSVSLSNGRRVERNVTATEGKTSVVLVESMTSSDKDSTDEEPEPEPEPAAPPKKKDAPASSSPWSTIGWVSVGAASVAAIGAVYFGVETLHARDDYNASGHRDASARDRAESDMHLTNICWAVAAISGASGAGILLFAPGSGQNNAAFAPRVVVHGTF